MTPEHLAQVLGKNGKFQLLLYIMLSMNYVYVCWNHLAMAFLGAETRHHCRLENKTDIARLVPQVNKGGRHQWDSCHLYIGYNTTRKVKCPRGWTYYLPNRERTIVAEWDLVCDDAYKTNLATTLYFCGVMLGSLVFGTLSDKFGRRPVLLFTMYSPCVIGLLLFFFQNYIAFVILRFVLGFFLEGLQIASYIFTVEVLSIQYRTFGGIFTSVFWSSGVMSLALISFLIQDWQYIQLFTTLAAVSQIGLFCLLPESFRWLLTKKCIDDAEQVIRRIAAFNKLPFPQDVFDEVALKSIETETEFSKPEKHYTVVDIFMIPMLFKRSIILALVWFSISTGYYGLALNVSSLAGNKYLNFFISGVLELGIAIITAFALQKYGRRKPMCFYSLVAGITCISAGILSDKAETDLLRKLTTSLALIGRIFISGCFSTSFIYTSELYPTVIRNIGLGAGLSWARIGSIIAPQVLLLGQHTTKPVPFIIFGGSVLVAGCLCLLLPETLNKRLAETVDEAETFEEWPRKCSDFDPSKKDDFELAVTSLDVEK